MRRITLLVAMMAVFTTTAQAGVVDLVSKMGGANIYTLHDFSAPSSDVEGALISGGNVTIAAYSVNDNNVDAFADKNGAGYAVIARNNLTLNGGSLKNGIAYVGGTMALSQATAPERAAASPIDFDATALYFKAVATNLSKVAGTGFVSDQWGGSLLTGGGSGTLDIFNVTTDTFRNSHSWYTGNLTQGQTLIFNISGASGTFRDGGVSFEPLKGFNVLFNFYEATSVNLSGVIGSVLAPNAAMNALWGQVNGNVIVDSWNSPMQVNANHYFKSVDVAGFTVPGVVKEEGNPASEVPEPGSIALALAALGVLGLLRRRSSKK